MKQLHERNIKRIFAMVICIITMTMFLPINLFASKGASETIKVGFFAFDGYHEIDKNGKKSGYGYDFLTLMKRYADVNYEYIGYNKSWSDMQQMLLDGEIDMVTSAHKTAEREELFDYSLPIGTNTLNLNIRADDDRFVVGDFKTYNGIILGLMEGSSSNEKIEAFAKENHFSFRAKYYTDSDSLEEALANGEVDAVATSSLRKTENEKTIAEFETEYFYAIVKKDNTALLEKINTAITAMNSSEGNWKSTLFYNNYELHNNTGLSFSEDEKAYIAAHSGGREKIVIAYDNKWAPFTYKEDGIYTGILPDIWDTIMQMTGMEYEVYDSGNDIIDENDLLEGKADIYMGYCFDASISENNGFVESSTFMSAGAAMLTRKGNHSLEMIGVSDVNPRMNSLLPLEQGQQLVHFAHSEEAVTALEKGEIDAVFLYAYEGELIVNRDKTGILVYQNVANVALPLCAVSPEDKSHVLIAIVSKCINSMSESDVNTIISKNMTLGVSDLTIYDYIKMHPIAMVAGAFGVAALILGIVFALLRGNTEKKHREVLEEKVEEITSLNDQLQDNQARLEESSAEQEAQLEEIIALNSELEERQAQLEEVSAEQEAQIEEISALNQELTVSRDNISQNYSIIRSLSEFFSALFYIDLSTYEYTNLILTEIESVERIAGESGDARRTFEMICENTIDDKFVEEVSKFTDVTTLEDRLRNQKAVSLQFIGQSTGWVEGAFIAAQRNSDGRCTHVLWAVRAINEQKEKDIAVQRELEAAYKVAEEQLAEIQDLNEKLKENLDIIANSGYGIWRITMKKDGNHTMIADRVLQEILGVTDMELSPEELYTFYHRRLIENVSEIEDDDYSEMESGVLRTRILEYEHPTKGQITLNAGGTSYGQDDGGMMISGYCGDITKQKRELSMLNHELEAALQIAADANKAKTDFLFSMSHDIRTPMNAVIGYANLMKKNHNDKERCLDYLDKIISSSDFLLDLINNVLEMARIESGKMVLDEVTLETISFNNSLFAVFEEEMSKKNISYTRSIDIQHEYLFCDSVKIREIFLNLLSNALKYTPAGGTIHMSLKELPSDRDGYALLQTTISDTGIGMSAEFLPRLFEEFSREKSVTENRIQGTGLGMPIVKKLVDLMSGSIEVESELGKGTTFVVQLYHRISSEKAMKKADIVENTIPDYSGKHILLAEDNDLNAEITIEILKETGAEVDRAEDGIICIDLLRKSEMGHYDLILMDIQMPNLDGYGATEKIRRAGFDIPIIAMTANAFEEDKREALGAGMNGHLSKPINVAELMKTLDGILG